MNNLAQFITIRGDELLFQSRCFEFNRNVIAVGGDQAIATLKAGDIRDLRIRQLQSILHPDCLVILQIQHNFGFGIIDDAFAILATVQCKEIVQVLCSCDSCSTVARSRQ